MKVQLVIFLAMLCGLVALSNAKEYIITLENVKEAVEIIQYCIIDDCDCGEEGKLLKEIFRNLVVGCAGPSCPRSQDTKRFIKLVKYYHPDTWELLVAKFTP